MLTYTELLGLLESGVIRGANPAHVNAASIDITLGTTLLVETYPNGGANVVDLMNKETPAMREIDLVKTGYYDLRPGEFCLAETVERFHLPNNLAAHYFLNSSLARAGLDAALAMWCVTGDTEVPLLDGTTQPIAALVGKQVWVYATDGAGRVVPGFASHVWHTKDVTELVKVRFDDGSSLSCTPEHRLRLRNGAWAPASDLQVGTPVMAVPRRANAHNTRYETVYSPTMYRRHWTPTHEIVDRHINGPLPRGYVVHHLDHDPNNNAPDNLVRMTLNEHLRHHHAELSPERLAALSQFRSDKASRENRKRWADAGNRKKMSEWAKASGAIKTLQRHQEGHGDAVRLSALTGCVKSAIDRLVESGRAVTSESYLEVKRQNAPTLATLEAAFGSFSQAVAVAGYENHRVACVERVSMDHPVPVYDMTVDAHHNFVLANGVVAHNCDPGWYGSVLTLEFKVNLNYHRLRLRPGMKCGQVVFERGEMVPDHASYAVRGRYNGDTQVQASKGVR